MILVISLGCKHSDIPSWKDSFGKSEDKWSNDRSETRLIWGNSRMMPSRSLRSFQTTQFSETKDISLLKLRKKRRIIPHLSSILCEFHGLISHCASYFPHIFGLFSYLHICRECPTIRSLFLKMTQLCLLSRQGTYSVLLRPDIFSYHRCPTSRFFL